MENKNSKVDKIIKELEQNLSKMTNEEREIFFKEMGFVFIEETPKERKQQLINLLTVLKAVLNLKIQSNSTQEKPLKQDVKKNQKEKTPTFEEIQKMMAFMTNKYQPPFTLKGTRHIPTTNEIEAMQKANERIKEGNLRGLEAKASAEKEEIVYCSLPDTTQATEEPKTGTEEMMAMLGIQGCLVPGSKEEHIDISDKHLRILGAQIDEDVRQCEQAEQESVAKLIKEGPKL